MRSCFSLRKHHIELQESGIVGVCRYLIPSGYLKGCYFYPAQSSAVVKLKNATTALTSF